MTTRSERRGWRPSAARRARLLLPAALCLLALAFSSACYAWADALPGTPQNSIRSIRTVLTGGRLTTYNITLTSSAEFPMNDAVVTLSIGGKEFINSGYGTDGTLHTLVFSLTRTEFQSLKNGASVVVYYGADNAAIPEAQWNFGTLDLGLLDQGLEVVTPVRSVTPVTPPVVTTLTAAARTMATMTAKTMTAETLMITAKVARKGHK